MNDFKLNDNPQITTGFNTPDNYFDDFSKKLLLQLPKEEPAISEVKVISFWSRNKNWMYVAAAIVIVALSIPMMNLLNSNSEEIKSAEIENYLSYHSTLSDDEIVEYLNEDDLNAIKIESNIESQTIEEILNDEVDIENQLLN